MNERLRQSAITFIWPGPVAGPLPVNLFRILAPVLVLYISPIPAALVMGFLASVLVVCYYRLLQLAEGKEYVQNLLNRLPDKAHQGVKNKGPIALFFSSFALGVFTYAILLRLLNYSETKAELLLIISAYVGSIIWTGLFWGFVVQTLKTFSEIAF